MGPFETSADALHAAVAAIGSSTDGPIPAGLIPAGNRKLLGRALEAAGVEMGRYDDRVAGWIAAQWEPSTVMVITRWVTDAYENGKRAGGLADG